MTEIKAAWFGESISNGSCFLGTVKSPGKLLCWGCTPHQVNQHLWRWDAGRSRLKLPQAILMCTQGGEPVPQRSDFHLIGCVLESPGGEVLKKSNSLSPTPEQMSQNMEKESDNCIFFSKLLQMIWYTASVKKHWYKQCSEGEKCRFEPISGPWALQARHACRMLDYFQEAIWGNGNSNGLGSYGGTWRHSSSLGSLL